MRTQICVVFCLVMYLILLGTVSNTDTPSLHSISPEHYNLEFNDSSLNESAPIQIGSDQDFAAQASMNNWTGNGTNADPFIIGKIRIASTSESIVLISIQDTTVFFSIENNLLVGGLTGLRLDNVTNGFVKNNTIRDCVSRGIHSIRINEVVFEENRIHDIQGGGVGIYFYECENSTIINCTVMNNAQIGLLLDYSENCSLIENNVFENNEIGIIFRDSDRNLIFRNNVSFHSSLGLSFGNSWYCNITENSVFNTSGDGIDLAESEHCVVVSNLIYNNTGRGLKVWGPWNRVTNNTFFNNDFAAIHTHRNGCEAKFNNFILNKGNEEYQQVIDGYGGNVFEYNYWSDWTWPDSNKDGIIDNAYQIVGDARNNDSHPVIDPYLEPRLHILSIPRFFLPTDIENTLYAKTNFTWGKVGDTHGHDVTYALYYTTLGDEWNHIVSGLEVNTYEWNVTILLEHQNYTFKVVATCSDGLNTVGYSRREYQIMQHTLTGLNIRSPNGGELIFLNEEYEIIWEIANDSIGHEIDYEIYLSPDGGDNWQLLGSNRVDCFTWSPVELTPGSNFLIKIIATCDEGLVIEDVSDAFFTIDIHHWWYDDFTTGPLTVVSITFIVILGVCFNRKRRNQRL